MHPHLSCGASTSLNLVNYQIHSILLAEVLHPVELPSLRLHWLCNYPRSRTTFCQLGNNRLLQLCQASVVFCQIFSFVFRQRILVSWISAGWPPHQRNVQEVDRLAVGHRQTPNRSPMETAMEGDDAHVGGSRGLVRHHRDQLLFRELCSPSAFSLRVLHEQQLHRILVAASAAHHGNDMIRSSRSNTHQNVLQPCRPVLVGEHTECRSIDERHKHLIRGGRLDQGRVVVAEGDRGDVREAVKHLVAISVNNVVPSGSFVVNEELDGGHRLDFAQLREQFLAFWTGNCGHQGGGGWLLEHCLADQPPCPLEPWLPF